MRGSLEADTGGGIRGAMAPANNGGGGTPRLGGGPVMSTGNPKIKNGLKTQNKLQEVATLIAFRKGKKITQNHFETNVKLPQYGELNRFGSYQNLLWGQPN